MKNLKRIQAEHYDRKRYSENEERLLMDGKLFVSDEYEWILLYNFGTPIQTDYGYDEPEEVLELIKYLIEDAPQRGYIEDAEPEDIKEICELLGEQYEEEPLINSPQKTSRSHTERD